MDYDLVDYLQLVLEHGGSDLHISVGAAPQLRVNGVLHAMGDIVLEPADAKDLIFASLKDTHWRPHEAIEAVRSLLPPERG